jgi:ATP-dependent Zn protease
MLYFSSFVITALLRPGRFEVQIEIPPPKTVAQRVSILKVHTKHMFVAGRLQVNDPPLGTAAAHNLEVSLLSSLLTLTSF